MADCSQPWMAISLLVILLLSVFYLYWYRLFKASKIQCSEEKLGKGGFSTVFKGRFGSRAVAVKRIVNDNIILDEITGRCREKDFLQNFKHPNILRLLHIEQDTNFWQVFVFSLQLQFDCVTRRTWSAGTLLSNCAPTIWKIGPKGSILGQCHLTGSDCTIWPTD